MPKVGGRRKKARSQKEGEQNDDDTTPRTFVFKKGKCSEHLKDLSLDFRKCFYPNTAMKLEDSNNLAIQSYLKAAKHYKVTHLVAFQQSKEKIFTRFIKVGGGEMLFKVVNYCRMKEVLLRKGANFSFSINQPLIVLNNFTENNQVRQIGRSIQEMFPSINLQKIKLQNIKRVISFTYQANKKFIYFRHYKLIMKEGGLNNSFKELASQATKDMSDYKSFADFLNAKMQGDSEKQTNQNQKQVKLVEIGPRMKLKFVSFKESFGIVEDDEEENENNEQNQDNRKILKKGKKISKKKFKNSKQDRQDRKQGQGQGDRDQVEDEE